MSKTVFRIKVDTNSSKALLVSIDPVGIWTFPCREKIKRPGSAWPWRVKTLYHMVRKSIEGDFLTKPEVEKYHNREYMSEGTVNSNIFAIRKFLKSEEAFGDEYLEELEILPYILIPKLRAISLRDKDLQPRFPNHFGSILILENIRRE